MQIILAYIRTSPLSAISSGRSNTLKVLLFAFLFRLETFSWRLIGVIVLIFSGVLLMVATETHFILHGFLLVITASALGGLRWGLTQILLHDKKLGLDNPAATVSLNVFYRTSLTIPNDRYSGCRPSWVSPWPW